jgi:hypothetical protein
MTSAIVDLRNRGEWDPAVLVASAIGWPTTSSVVELNELVGMIVSSSVYR